MSLKIYQVYRDKNKWCYTRFQNHKPNHREEILLNIDLILSNLFTYIFALHKLLKISWYILFSKLFSSCCLRCFFFVFFPRASGFITCRGKTCIQIKCNYLCKLRFFLYWKSNFTVIVHALISFVIFRAIGEFSLLTASIVFFTKQHKASIVCQSFPWTFYSRLATLSLSTLVIKS